MKKILLKTIILLVLSSTVYAQKFTCNNGQEIEGLQIIEFNLSEDKTKLTFENKTINIKDDGDNYSWMTVEYPYPMNRKKTKDVKRELKKDLSQLTVYGEDKEKWKCSIN